MPGIRNIYSLLKINIIKDYKWHTRLVCPSAESKRALREENVERRAAAAGATIVICDHDRRECNCESVCPYVTDFIITDISVLRNLIKAELKKRWIFSFPIAWVLQLFLKLPFLRWINCNIFYVFTGANFFEYRW